MSNKTLLISVERSGLAMFRIFTEKFTGYRTPDGGYKSLKGGGKMTTAQSIHGQPHYDYGATKPQLAFARSHNIQRHGIIPFDYPYDHMILLLRDYKYAFYRGYQDKLLDNIIVFDTFKGKKMVMYYEDLIKECSSYYRAWEFMGLKYTEIDDFADAQAYARKLFLKRKRNSGYKSIGHAPGTYARELLLKASVEIEDKLTEKQKSYLERYF
jgi:hypothetical protein